jgi:hypothetical protein
MESGSNLPRVSRQHRTLQLSANDAREEYAEEDGEVADFSAQVGNSRSGIESPGDGNCVLP